MMSLWDALRMNMMISYQELVRTFPKTARERKAFMSFLNSIAKGTCFLNRGMIAQRANCIIIDFSIRAPQLRRRQGIFSSFKEILVRDLSDALLPTTSSNLSTSYQMC